MLRRPVRFAALALLLVLFFAGPSAVGFYTDWLWFGEVGYQSVFLTMLRAQATLFVAAFTAAALWLAFNFRLALAAVGDLRSIFTTREGVQLPLPGRRQMHTIASSAATVLAVFVGLYASSRWETWLAWRNAVPFGTADPILGLDAGFYVFWLPFLQMVRGLAQGLVLMAALAAGLLYFVSGSVSSRFGSIGWMTPAARRHLSLLAAAFLLLLAFGAWLGQAERLVQPSAVIHGPGYADVHGRIPATLLLAAAAAVGASLAVFHGTTPRNWPIPVAAALYVLVAIGGEVYSTIVQRFIVAPNEQSMESPYIQHNIDATRRAFALDRVEARELSGDALLTLQDIKQDSATIENVRLWDHQPLLDAFGQLQVIRTYYDFVAVDNDRYRIGGQLRQIMLSPRELSTASLPNRTWVNDRLTFTHGYGLTLGPVNQVTEEGLPVLFVRNLPLETIPELPIDEPSLYYGELSSDYVIVRTATREFHYPRGEDNVFTPYAGTGGLPIGSIWRKLLFALRFGAYQIILSNDINEESRILFYRNIRERVQKLAPFLSFDRDPYLVVADGRLYWMYDAYTTSTRYPYSTPAGPGGISYIRNAVKIVIDAYHGTTTVYLADPADPIAATYARAFPDLFAPLDRMPASLREHVRYPEDIFAIQASVFATYHMTQPSVFYNREDQWEVPVVEDSNEGGAMQPYYTIMRLPGETEPEFIQMLPFTPRNRDNLAGWLAARSDGEHYGRLRVFQFPKQRVIFGPRQVVARINQDQAISPQITLWNQQGSQVIWGTLMVIPIDEALIYVRPLYLRGSGGRIPELTRVIVAYQNQIVMEETLDAALARLFGSAPGGDDLEPVRAPVPPGAPAVESPAPSRAAGTAPGGAPELAALAAQARIHYDRAVQAQRNGDWATYGEELKRLGDVLVQMRAR
ncbi:MAG: hypothetical protein A3I61_15260 [Acidobacteria bacterium RIFCSPLOWO2_02_FULL_68_18]|nr:MAG: hypothetical protein A3I61_15260 [Acidobacteria bacterium RIFCSPLOWO2_02_FULL_68_18]OFW49915.1 MAG: hypothetical protein A3G77_10900 [Acidobacteria bacterium RIFCSPLOWO2_12_FULL_68_19]